LDVEGRANASIGLCRQIGATGVRTLAMARVQKRARLGYGPGLRIHPARQASPYGLLQSLCFPAQKSKKNIFKIPSALARNQNRVPNRRWEMKSQARVVVIGGGIAGCSTLYHLTQEGWSDVVLVERDELTSGTTWHSAAQVTNFGMSQVMIALKSHSIKLYKELAAR